MFVICCLWCGTELSLFRVQDQPEHAPCCDACLTELVDNYCQ